MLSEHNGQANENHGVAPVEKTSKSRSMLEPLPGRCGLRLLLFVKDPDE